MSLDSDKRNDLMNQAVALSSSAPPAREAKEPVNSWDAVFVDVAAHLQKSSLTIYAYYPVPEINLSGDADWTITPYIVHHGETFDICITFRDAITCLSIPDDRRSYCRLMANICCVMTDSEDAVFFKSIVPKEADVTIGHKLNEYYTRARWGDIGDSAFVSVRSMHARLFSVMAHRSGGYVKEQAAGRKAATSTPKATDAAVAPAPAPEEKKNKSKEKELVPVFGWASRDCHGNPKIDEARDPKKTTQQRVAFARLSHLLSRQDEYRAFDHLETLSAQNDPSLDAYRDSGVCWLVRGMMASVSDVELPKQKEVPLPAVAAAAADVKVEPVVIATEDKKADPVPMDTQTDSSKVTKRKRLHKLPDEPEPKKTKHQPKAFVPKGTVPVLDDSKLPAAGARVPAISNRRDKVNRAAKLAEAQLSAKHAIDLLSDTDTDWMTTDLTKSAATTVDELALKYGVSITPAVQQLNNELSAVSAAAVSVSNGDVDMVAGVSESDLM